MLIKMTDRVVNRGESSAAWETRERCHPNSGKGKDFRHLSCQVSRLERRHPELRTPLPRENNEPEEDVERKGMSLSRMSWESGGGVPGGSLLGS